MNQHMTLREFLARLWPFSGADSGASEYGEGSVWDAIPSWQYGGRHAESGGIAHDAQERALADIEEQAEERGGSDPWE